MVYSAQLIRTMALELQRRVNTINLNLSPILQTVNQWTTNNLDVFLPAPYGVRVALQQYQALRLDRIRLDDLVDLILKAKIEDTILITAVQSNDLWPLIYNEQLIFTPIVIF
jgi:hypothetical protein